MEVLVIGAGVAGLAAAHALSVGGHRVRVFERAGALRDGGAALTLWSNGTGILDDFGISLNGYGAPIDVMEQRDQHGRRLAGIDVARAADAYGHPTICLPRHRLLQRLAADLPPGTIFFNRSCTVLGQDGERVAAEFDDGTRAEGDLLIGADGHRSVVRDHLWGADPTEPSGWASWQGLSPVPIDITTSRRCLLITGKGGTCGLMPAGEGLLQWWFDLPWSPEEAAPASPMSVLRERFGDWASPVPEVLAGVDDTEVGFFPHYRHRVPRHWGSGRITLAGDSAHTMPPARAQGANQALEDAWTLAATLRERRDVPSALRTYEQARSKRAGLVARHASTEDINRYPPAVARLLPDPLLSRYYTRWLRRISNYLSRS
jgi:FAD-dependent urate hydroxylase